MELILGMQEKGWQHIHYNHLIALIAEETEILVTSKGPFIFYREDTDD